jgi:hypothetical protein
MKFEIKHTFNCTPERLWELFEDATYEAKLAEASSAAREVLERREEAGEQIVRRKISSKRSMPAPLTKLIGGDQVSYEQETRRKLNAEVMTWRIIPHVLQDRFKGSGTTTVRATAGGCERIITGDFTVSIPLMGGKLEAQLVEVISAGYDKGAGVLREMLAAG